MKSKRPQKFDIRKEAARVSAIMAEGQRRATQRVEARKKRETEIAAATKGQGAR